MLRRSLLALCAGMALTAFTGFAQEFRGSLSGRIIDQQQAVVPGAKIVVQTETGAKSQTSQCRRHLRPAVSAARALLRLGRGIRLQTICKQ